MTLDGGTPVTGAALRITGAFSFSVEERELP
jgi:hypothetical protein